MNLSQVKPAHYFATQYGVKCLTYGDPGVGKTPCINTAPNPILMACEPGLLSMRNSNVATVLLETAFEIDDYFRWVKSSQEAKQFQTLGFDSVSQMCEIYVRDDYVKNPKKHGLQVYGEMAEKVMGHMYDVYHRRECNVYAIAKQVIMDNSGVLVKRPYFPGNVIPVQLPHLFDLILHMAYVDIPGVGNQIAFRTRSTYEVIARDRSGMANELEPPDLGALFNKCMSMPQ